MRFVEGKPYENLANAIILLAVKDYRKAMRTLRRRPDCISARMQRDEVERFFLSDWFAKLTTLDGENLMNRLREEVAG
ncbi:MAG: hypothetical protein IKN79_07790 [Eubacterium sp.]|nr:hypothetical protein [Eubacterium sp.]